MKFLNTWQNKDGANVDLDGHTHTASEVTDFVATVRATVLTGLSTATNAVIAATDTVLGALGKLQAQISGHVSGHTNIALKSNTDNRAVATTPNDYNAVLKVAGLKTNTAIGSPDASTYSGVMGIRGWTDSSGGNSHEIAFTGNGYLRHRTGATTAWGAWSKIYTSADPPGYNEIDSAPTKLSEFENDIAAGRGTVFTLSATAPADPVAGDFWNKIL
jgi:hypothetical protein